MEVIIKPENFWGTLDASSDFSRLSLNEDNLHVNALAKYNSGMFLILRPQEKVNNIILNYKIHYPIKQGIIDQSKANIQKVAIYTLVKVDGIWRSIDSQSLFNKSLGVKNINLSDTLLKIQHDVSYYSNISEIQICLPSLGYLKYLNIQMNCNFLVVPPKKLKTIFLGGSLGTFNFVNAQSCLPCYLYRKYEINTCTTAIPKSHSFNCSKLMYNLLNKYNNIDKIVVDLENLKEEDNIQTLKYLSNLESFIFKPSVVHSNVDKLIKLAGIKNVLDADASMCCDWGHPNSYGIIRYISWLIDNGKLVGKESEN